jgi:hypothetical protein
MSGNTEAFRQSRRERKKVEMRFAHMKRILSLEDPAQDIALSEAFLPRPAEHGVVGYLVFDPELAEPAIGKVDLNLGANPPLRTDRKHVANSQHSDHQHRVNRRSAHVRVIRSQLLVDPTQIQQTVDLPHQLIRWDHLIQIKRVKEVTLTILPPTHHAPLPPMTP